MKIFKLKRNNKMLDITTEWLSSKKKIKIQTYQKYENIINSYIKNSILDIKMKKVNDKLIKIFFNDLERKNVSKSIQKTILYIIKATIAFGYTNNYCKRIHLNEIKISKIKNNIEIFTAKEQLDIENYLKEKINIRKVCILLCLYTGLRLGEVCGLKWGDIDFNNKTLEVKRTIQRIRNVNPTINSKTILIESTPKGETSKRIVPIADFLFEILKQFKSNDHYYLLSNSKNIYEPRVLEAYFSKILISCHIKNYKFHTLRHTFATRCMESKMDIKTLSEILGHADIETTLRLYIHPSLDLKKNSIEEVVQFMYSYK